MKTKNLITSNLSRINAIATQGRRPWEKVSSVRGYYLIIILLVASLLRLYKLGTIPPALTSDEASLGYNAFSILKTGRDEYGSLLPILFKSFGDWKPGLYVYLTVPFVAIFGLNEWVVRLPSALAGVVAVWLIYKIILLLFTKQKPQLPTNYPARKSHASSVAGGQLLASLSAAFLAINPWHIQFSRGAWEVNVALTLTLAGIYFFLKAVGGHSGRSKATDRISQNRDPSASLRMTRVRPALNRLFMKKVSIVWSAFFFSLTLVTYQGAKLSTAVVVILLIIIFWNKLIHLARRLPARVMVAGLVGVVIAIPILLSLFQGKTGRLEVFSIFSYPRKEIDIEQVLDQGQERFGGLSYNLYHSEGVNFARAILGRWFNHFSTRFLIFEGDWPNPRHSPPNQGMLLLWELILLPLGLFAFFKKKLSKEKVFILGWLILAPLPSILSRDSVHAVRAYNLIIPLTIISAYGLLLLLNQLSSFARRLQVVGYGLVFILFFGSFIYYTDAYFVHLPRHGAKNWSYGYKQIVETIAPLQEKYKTIKIQQSFAQPYIYYLFYTLYDPSQYQSRARLVESEYAFDVGYVERIDNIEFAAIDWPRDRQDKGTLVAADSIRIPPGELAKEGVQLIKEIKYPDGNTAFYVVEVI